jgi:Putative zinc-finger
MIKGSSCSRSGGALPSGPHDEFPELCALSTSGELSERDENRLKQHLALCPECREALLDYQALIHDTTPAIGVEASGEPFLEIDPGPNWSESHSEKRLFERLEQDELHRTGKEEAQAYNNRAYKASTGSDSFSSRTSSSTWRHVWMLYAAGILLFVTLAFSAYWVGIRRGVDVATTVPDAQNQVAGRTNSPSFEEQLSDAAHEREIARAQLAERDQLLTDLRQQLEKQSAEIRRMRQAQVRVTDSTVLAGNGTCQGPRSQGQRSHSLTRRSRGLA